MLNRWRPFRRHAPAPGDRPTDPAAGAGAVAAPTDQDGALAPIPEQPVPLAPLPGARRAKVGVVLPARRPGSLALAIPRVPKRAIFAAGLCAGLAVPGVTRQLAGRALIGALGRGRRPRASAEVWETATIEIVRITRTGPRGGTVEAIGKLLEQLRR
jgi:hypothetical protein